jgi:hypothetical protein
MGARRLEKQLIKFVSGADQQAFAYLSETDGCRAELRKTAG